MRESKQASHVLKKLECLGLAGEKGKNSSKPLLTSD